MRLFGTAQRIGLADSPFTEDTYSSIETEEEMEQLFNAGMKKGRDKEPRKDEDENQTNETSEETTEKKDDKKFTV